MLTTDFGKLTPFMCMEVLPGDSFKVNSEVFARVAPMVAPIMSRVDIKTYFFFVPNRILWNGWEDFITGGEDGRTIRPMPMIEQQAMDSLGSFTTGSLGDYMGLFMANRMNHDHNSGVCALPFMAYQKIYNDWFRDQNLQDEIAWNKDADGNQLTADELTALMSMRYACWEKDYLTSALPWPQRGPEVVLPLKEGDIRINDFTLHASNEVYSQGDMKWLRNGQQGRDITLRTDDGNTIISASGEGRLESVAPTIRELRKSISVQQWLENNARGGARYIEQLLTHFGVKSSDARLQRAELLGGGTSPVLISEVLQTSPSDVDGISTVGNMAGHGVSANRTHSFKRYFEEHGFVIGICFVRPKNSYMSGVHRMWLRQDKFDFAWPEFARIGEQEIKNVEVQTNHPNGDGVFGYAPRYSEYKYHGSEIHGDFLTTMDSWHTARKFSSDPGKEPKLNANFVSMRNSSQSLERIFAFDADGVDHFWLQIYNNIKVKRCLPYYGTPSI